MKSSGAKCAEQTNWILARSPVLSISNHDWNPLSFSQLPILYHCIREFDEWKSPFISSFVLLQPNATHRCTMFSPFAKEKHCAIEKSAKMAVLYWRHRPLSPGSRHARFCIEPEVKFHVFVGLKRGEEKLIGNLFFRFSYENNMKIRTSN